MSDSEVGLLALACISFVAISAVLVHRRRSPEEVITRGTARGQAGLSIHPWRGHRVGPVAAWVIALGVSALGVGSFFISAYPGVLFTAAGLYLLFLAWAGSTGRAGDGTMTMTPEGVQQRLGGAEVFVPWEAVRGLVTTPKVFIFETDRGIAPVTHLRGMFGFRRAVHTESAISLSHTMLPPLPYQEMVDRYASDPTARDELASDEAVERARRLLAPPEGVIGDDP